MTITRRTPMGTRASRKWWDVGRASMRTMIAASRVASTTFAKSATRADGARKRLTVQPETNKRNEFIASLRMAADYFEQRPSLPCPSFFRIDVFPQPEALAEIAKAMGSASKDYPQNDYFILKKKL